MSVEPAHAGSATSPVEVIFLEASRLEGEARLRLVRERCGGRSDLEAEVLELLAHHGRSRGVLDRPPPTPTEFVVGASTAGDPLPPGSRIGGFVIRSMIGAGGMGVVYLAEQERPRRNVAIKLVRPGFASRHVLRRFEHEAEMLGRFQHPGIAQIIEAGEKDLGSGAQPYFAMEHIIGRPLVAYADAERLDQPARIELFLKVCAAVEHAHRRGVIHRDLKPDNILVTDAGEPKILDFGVARATARAAADGTLALTGEHQIVGTVSYMSPEQAAGDVEAVDTRSDVYALGVVLFELLGGARPHDLTGAPIHEALRRIRFDEPLRLGAIAPGCRGDVETIVAKALEAEPGRRYQSAAELAMDLRRFLNHETILARRASSLYVIRKFARRNKAIVAGSAIALASILAALVATLVALQRVRHERDNASAAAVRTGRVATILKGALESVDPSRARGRDTALMQSVLESTERQIETGLADAPDLASEFRVLLADVYRHLEMPEPALRNAALAVETAPEGAARAAALSRRGRLRCEQGDHDGGDADLAEAAAIYVRERGPRSAELAEVLAQRASGRARRGDLVEAEAQYRAAIAMELETRSEESPEVCVTKGNLAQVLAAAGRLDEAERLMSDVIAVRRRLGDSGIPGLVRCLDALAGILHAQHRWAEAETTVRESLDIQRRQMPDDLRTMANSEHMLATLLYMRGERAEAAELLRDAVRLTSRVYGDDAAEVVPQLRMLASVLIESGDPAGAEAALERAAGILRVRGIEGTEWADVLSSMVATASARDDDDRAEGLHRQALAIYESKLPAGHATIAQCRFNLAGLLVQGVWKRRATATIDDRRKAEEAESILREAVAAREAKYGAEHWMTAGATARLGAAIVDQAVAALASDPSSQGEADATAFFVEAESLLLRAAEVAAAQEAASPSPLRARSTRSAVEWLVRLYDAWSAIDPAKADMAAAWSTRLAASDAKRPLP